jgi:gas vesicle protein
MGAIPKTERVEIHATLTTEQVAMMKNMLTLGASEWSKNATKNPLGLRKRCQEVIDILTEASQGKSKKVDEDYDDEEDGDDEDEDEDEDGDSYVPLADLVFREHCPECDVGLGHPHKAGCSIERCSNCGEQHSECSCKSSRHDPAFARWTGFFPGEAEAYALGISLDEFLEGKHAKCIFIKPRMK